MLNRLPSKTTMYQALCERDTSFEGLFFFGVTTTGIFCRPTCPARKPKANHVEYFLNPKQAVAAGYRACFRCHPLEPSVPAPALVQRLVDLLERSLEKPVRSSDLTKLGIDPSTARRQFRRKFGMTFHEYQRAQQIGLAFQELRDGKPVIEAQLNHGYKSTSGFWQAFRKVLGEPPSRTGAIEPMLSRWIDTPLGPLLALANREGIWFLEFMDREAFDACLLSPTSGPLPPVVPGSNSHLDLLCKDLECYFRGSNQDFRSPLVLRGTPFEQSVWQALQQVPCGSTLSYQDLAKRIGRPKAFRAVGRTNGKNPLCIVVPCHRIVGSSGRLTGYSGGLWRKRWLLEHEKRMTSKKSTKFKVRSANFS